MRLHRLIRHAGIHTWRIIAVGRRNGGGRSYYIIGIWAQLADAMRRLPFWGLFLEAREDIPKNIF